MLGRQGPSLTRKAAKLSATDKAFCINGANSELERKEPVDEGSLI